VKRAKNEIKRLKIQKKKKKKKSRALEINFERIPEATDLRHW
jgi:uncharacterized small protein (DUF1192 family)